jgi:hypothetical protein
VLYRLSYPADYGHARAPVQVIATTHSPHLLDLFRDHPEEIVIADKHGRAATFARLSDRPDLEALLAIEPECAVYCAMGDNRMPQAFDDVRRILAAGVNVVGSAPVVLQFPWNVMPDKFIESLEEAGRQGNSSIYINGVDPGFVTDLIPLAFATTCARIEQVRCMEIADYATYDGAIVMFDVMGFGKPLDEVPRGSERGFALEAQLHAVLDPCASRAIPTFSLDGRARSKAVFLRADYALPFLTATETTPAATTSVLYLPKANGYPCDAIIVPAANSDLSEPVVLLESSVTPPTDDGRLNKLLAWLKAAPPQCTAAKREATQADSAEAKRAPEEFGGFIDMVKAAHPTRPVVAVLCWLGRCEAAGDSGDGGAGYADGAAASVAADGAGAGGAAKTKQSTEQKQPESKKQRLTEAAKANGVELCVLDTSGLHILGVRTTR